MLERKKLNIVAAIDTSPFSVAVLDEAVMYAKLFDANLKVVMVEDINMLNAARSPLVRSVNLFSFSSGSINSNEVEDIYSLQRKTAKQTVKYASEKHDVKITLDIRRGKVLDEILKGAEGCDALIIGLAGWRFAKYYYSTHMLHNQSRFKFPDDSNITVGNTAKQLLQNFKGTIFALRGSVFKNCRVMIYYDGSKLSKLALLNTVDYLSQIKNRTNVALAILLDSKTLRNEAFLAVSNRDKAFSPSFYTLKDGKSKETLVFIEKLIDNSKSNVLIMPGACRFMKDKVFYEELDVIHSSLIIIR